MEVTKRKPIIYKTFCLLGSIFLIVMAIFHGSGFFYVREAIIKSSAEDFLKEIVPVLFTHPSIHLIGLATFGMLAVFLKHEAKKILTLLSVMVTIDAGLAFFLGGTIPGILLTTTAIFFITAGLKIDQIK